MTVFKKIIITAVLIFTASYNQLFAEPSPQNRSVGITGFYGYSDMRTRNSVQGIEPGFSAGGGFVFETMFSNRFGFRTGIEYGYSQIGFNLDDQYALPFDVKWNFHKIIVPLQFITSFSTDSFSFNLLTGMNYSHIFITKMTSDTSVIVDTHNDDAKKYINPHQFGISAGIIFRFRFTKFTDFIIGAEGDYFLTNLLDISGSSDDMINVMEARCITGWMFRTDIFPIAHED